MWLLVSIQHNAMRWAGGDWGSWKSGTHPSKEVCCYVAPESCCCHVGVLASVARPQILQEKPDICIFKNLNLLNFNSIFKKYCVCGAKCICKLDAACGLRLSTSVPNPPLCWREPDANWGAHLHAHLRRGLCPACWPGIRAAGIRAAELMRSGLKSRQLKTRFRVCTGLLPSWGLGKSAGLKKILFANLLTP